MLQLQQKESLCKQLYQASKKLVSVLTTSAPVTEASQENDVFLDWVLYICYPIWFKKSKVQVQALINSDSKVNVMTSGYALKLGLKVCLTNIRVQKIDSSTLETFKIVLAKFQMENTLGKVRFF